MARTAGSLGREAFNSQPARHTTMISNMTVASVGLIHVAEALRLHVVDDRGDDQEHARGHQMFDWT